MAGDTDWIGGYDRTEYPAVRPFMRTTRLAGIKYWDIGTGNCNGLYDQNGAAFIYYDFGGNATKGAPSYPGVTPAFDYTDDTVFFMSHWDNDHCYSLKKSAAAADSVWIGPRESIAPRTQKVVATVSLLFVWSATSPTLRTYTSEEGLTIRFHRLPGNPHGGHSVADRRNNEGISLEIGQTRPNSALRRLQAVAAAFEAPGASYLSVVQAVGGLGTDFFANLVVHAVHAVPPTCTPLQVFRAAHAGYRMSVAWALGNLITVAERTARTIGADANSVAQAVTAAAVRSAGNHGLVRAVRNAATAAAQQLNATAVSVAAAARGALNGATKPPSLDTFLAMLTHALANPTDTAGTAARGVPGNDDYVNHVIEQAYGAARVPGNANNAAAVVDAALGGLLFPDHFETRILLTGDGCYSAHAQAIANFYDKPWDAVLAYHHGSYVDFVGASVTTLNQSPAPRPALPGRSELIYSSGLTPAGARIHGHPPQNALTKYRNAGWTAERFTAAVEGNPARGDLTYTLPT